MRRAIGFLGTILLIALSFSLYTLVNAVKVQERTLKALDVAIAKESENTRVLKADWSYLNQPERLQALARQHLTLVPTVARQIVILANLPEKSAVIETSAVTPSVDASQLPFREIAPAAAVVAPKALAIVPEPKAIEPKVPAAKTPEPKAPAVVAASKAVPAPVKPALAQKPAMSPKAAPPAKGNGALKANASQKANAIARKATPAQGLP